MPKLEQMTEQHEDGIEDEKKEVEIDDYLDYFYAITDEETPYEQLERLLRRRHKTLPGEREAYLKLKEHEIELGHPLKVALDETGFHVIPLEDAKDTNVEK